MSNKYRNIQESPFVFLSFKLMSLILLMTVVTISGKLEAKENKKVIRIASIDWCPQLCPNKPFKGYVNDVISKVYESSEFTLVVDYFPWSRAIKVVRQGTYDALLSPAKAEAPDLVYPSMPVGTQQMCFFVSSSSKWHYKDTRSLAGLDIGIAKDTSIEELNVYMSNNIEQFQFQPYLERYVEQSAKKVLKHRIDTFLFTKNTTLFELGQIGLKGKIKEAGCVSKANIYIAFTPAEEKKELVQKLINLFDQKVKSMKESGEISEIMRKYNLQ